MSEHIETLVTEANNANSAGIEQLSTLDMVRIINNEDKKVALAVEKALPQIAQAIDQISLRLRRGGRMIYLGAGTSGRLGLMDATECPPTYNTDPNMVIGLLAGGDAAFRYSSEGDEDNETLGVEDLKKIGLTEKDVVVGITASGRTPYVLGALAYGRQIGALCIGLACNENSETRQRSDINIEVPVGPEIVTGSTRMKAGTAQKLVLNMLSTGTMIRLGKTYSNWMVDVRPTNHKLRVRARHIIKAVCHVDDQKAEELLAACDGEVKTVLVSWLLKCTPARARSLLEEAAGSVQAALELGKHG